MPPAKLIGITGSIGSGKSLVGNLLKERGYPVIDTDEVVHDLFQNSGELKERIRARFGDDVIGPDGKIDRMKLGSVVFENEDARKDLERIVHPAVLAESQHLVGALPDQTIAFMLVPLLFEAQVQRSYDEIWTVVADENVLRERLKKRSNLNDEQISKRLAAQLPQSVKAAQSDRVIDNSGTISDTTIQIDKILVSLQ